MSFASGTFNGNATAKTLANMVNDDASVKAQVWARYLDVASRQHNAFAKFESEQPKRAFQSTGQRGVFAKKRDLRAVGGDTVTFTVMSAPAGPGVIGENELTGNTSSPSFKTYSCKVDYKRDAVELTKKAVKMIAVGNQVESTVLDMLALKMGMWKQNDLMMSLSYLGYGNTVRPNGRADNDALLHTDVLTPSFAVESKARLNTLGAIPISKTMNEAGDMLAGYMVFATEYAMLNVRNSSGYDTAMQAAGIRGDANPQFTGRMPNWQGLNWYEHVVTDLDWDDYLGSPLQPKVRSGVAFNADSAAGLCRITGSAYANGAYTNTKSKYTQFMGGYAYPFTDGSTGGTTGSPDYITQDAGPHYAMAYNPVSNTYCFMEWTTGNNGNQITPSKILSTAAGTSNLGATTVGGFVVGSGASVNGSTRVITPGSGDTLPAALT